MNTKNKEEIKIGDYIHANYSGQYISVQVLDIKKKLFGVRYWCKFSYTTGTYGIEWFKKKNLILN